MIEIISLKNIEREQLFSSFDSRKETDADRFSPVVQEILNSVKEGGNRAVIAYTEKFDGVKLTKENLMVSNEEIEAAYGLVEESYIKALRAAIERITAYHSKQKENSWFTSEGQGIMLGQKVSPLASVGIYVPGGTAAYPSSVLMNAIPAIVAGVKNIVMVTPPDQRGSVNPGVLVAAKELGLTAIYKVGGAQAIGALAYGTESIPKVDKIVGPGNIYVATAKRLVYGLVDIDMIAGPSEILVIADETAKPRYVAADLLSQAEHDELASAICITTSHALALQIKEEVIAQTKTLERSSIIERALRDYGSIIVVEDLMEAVALSNQIAPEHLELCVDQPFDLLNSIEHAGAIFLGHYSPEPLGDYMAGPNHVLPTSGTARFFSPLSVGDFTKKSSIIYYQQGALQAVKDDIMVLAEEEGLTAHKNAIKVRFD